MWGVGFNDPVDWQDWAMGSPMFEVSEFKAGMHIACSGVLLGMTTMTCLYAVRVCSQIRDTMPGDTSQVAGQP